MVPINGLFSHRHLITQTRSITAVTQTSCGRSSARVAPSSSEAVAALPPTTLDSDASVTSTASVE